MTLMVNKVFGMSKRRKMDFRLDLMIRGHAMPGAL
jgi:hypothetical protein